jgi:hypothetical protein
MQSSHESSLNPLVFPLDRVNDDIQNILDYYRGLRINPAKATTLQLAATVVELTEHINLSSVTIEKNGQSLHPLVNLTIYSDITKASDAQYKMRTPTVRQEPDFDVSYAAGRRDLILSCYRPLYLPPDAAHVTATGVPFEPVSSMVFSNPYIKLCSLP